MKLPEIDNDINTQSRRQFIKRSVGTALMFGSGSAFLSSCCGDPTFTTAAGASWPSGLTIHDICISQYCISLMEKRVKIEVEAANTNTTQRKLIFLNTDAIPSLSIAMTLGAQTDTEFVEEDDYVHESIRSAKVGVLDNWDQPIGGAYPVGELFWKAKTC